MHHTGTGNPRRDGPSTTRQPRHKDTSSSSNMNPHTNEDTSAMSNHPHHEAASWANDEPLNSSSHHFERRRRLVQNVDFPNSIKVHCVSEETRQSHDNNNKNDKDRLSVALNALEKEIQILEKDMIQAGQAGDVHTAQSKQAKRNELKYKKTQLEQVSRRKDKSSAWLLHEVEQALTSCYNSSSSSSSPSRRGPFERGESTSSSSSSSTPEGHAPLDSGSTSSRLSQPSFPNRGKQKKKMPLQNQEKDVLWGSAASGEKEEDISKDDVVHNKNANNNNNNNKDDRLVTIYEMEKTGMVRQASTQEEDEEEACIKRTNVHLVDPYGDEGRYTGMMLERTGVPHGLGRFWYKDDDRTYEGEWRFGQWHGFGRSTCINGDVYEGEYQHDQRHGIGTYTWKKDQKVYKGDFHHDRRHGRGIMTWPNEGIRYNGGFVMGKLEGRGKMTFPDGQVQVGEWIAGQYQKEETTADRRNQEQAAAAAADHHACSNEVSLSSSSLSDLPRHTTRMSRSFSEASQDTEQEEEWTCGMCTYVNTDPLHLSCAVCGNARICKNPVTLEHDSVETTPFKSDSNEQRQGNAWVEVRNRNLV